MEIVDSQSFKKLENEKIKYINIKDNGYVIICTNSNKLLIVTPGDSEDIGMTPLYKGEVKAFFKTEEGIKESDIMRKRELFDINKYIEDEKMGLE